MQNQKAAAETKAAQNEVRIEAMQQELNRQAKELQQARQAAAQVQEEAKAQQERLAHASLWQRITGHW